MRARRIVKIGAPVFVTQVTHNRNLLFADTANIQLFREVLHRCKDRHPFRMIAFAFLPDHMHLLIEPQDNATISMIMAATKAEFSIEFRKSYELAGRVDLWQKGFWDHIIRDEDDLRRHIDYIHYNPVHHGLTNKPEDWPHSSFGWWKINGHYEDGWGWTNLMADWIPAAHSWPVGVE